MDDLRPRLVTNNNTVRDDLVASLILALDTRCATVVHRVEQLSEVVTLMLDTNRELVNQLERLANNLSNIMGKESSHDARH